MNKSQNNCAEIIYNSMKVKQQKATQWLSGGR